MSPLTLYRTIDRAAFRVAHFLARSALFVEDMRKAFGEGWRLAVNIDHRQRRTTDALAQLRALLADDEKRPN